jgi:hypothetical protein
MPRRDEVERSFRSFQQWYSAVERTVACSLTKHFEILNFDDWALALPEVHGFISSSKALMLMLSSLLVLPPFQSSCLVSLNPCLSFRVFLFSGWR